MRNMEGFRAFGDRETYSIHVVYIWWGGSVGAQNGSIAICGGTGYHNYQNKQDYCCRDAEYVVTYFNDFTAVTAVRRVYREE